MRILCLSLFILLNLGVSASNPVEDFDLRSYSPVKNGLKDLYCEIRIKGLAKKIREQFITLKIKDEVFFKFYWVYPGKLEFVVEGLPSGFSELKDNLKRLIVSRADYIIPQKLFPKLRSYQLNVKKSGKDFLVKADDPTNGKTINKMEMKFTGDGRLSQYKSYSPLGFEESKFSYLKKSWSKNKWVLEKVEAKAIQGPQVTESTSVIKFENNVGYGLPVKVDIVSRQYVAAPGKKERLQERSGGSQVTFSNYKVNSGIARKFFRLQE